ncbi:unnamed protein product [Didymodactylos carnosus]|uniref:LRAT domain-containing protein n=1 Tax=Didymodactylos carnosus TaxID=1234261 RepID=A0A814ABP4_9BILA|nr:unnamed protein product [Didymodactylos carnosus]CAF1283028.1 unnamed protein product [Didymodactylos carnosus]CAF3691611.1 unnamed protein product [Didymodactylos carnosus]CAF4087851.1 unnamed protein product [Didymodactylos carnosus]
MPHLPDFLKNKELFQEPIFHSIAITDVHAGDHVYVWRVPLFQHHGVILSVDENDYDQSEVLEFNTPDGSLSKTRAQIQIVPLRIFRKGRKLKRVMYSSKVHRFKLAGTAYAMESLPAEIVVENARFVLKQIESGYEIPDIDFDGKYNLIGKNCECLAYFCKTGIWYSTQIEKVVHWVGKPLLTFIKGFFDLAIAHSIIQSVEQEALSEAIESSFCIFENKFCSTLFAEGIGQAIAVVIVEIVKLCFRVYQYKQGQMTKEEFYSKTLKSLIQSLSIGIFSLLIQGFLTYFTFGSAAFCPFVGGFAGAIIGSLVGEILARLIVNGTIVAHHKLLTD